MVLPEPMLEHIGLDPDAIGTYPSGQPEPQTVNWSPSTIRQVTLLPVPVREHIVLSLRARA